MSYLFTLFTILATLLQLASTSVVLRIRLSNGIMQRLELDEQVETMVSIKERLRKDGSISTDDTHFTLKGKSYSVLAVSASLEDENISIDKLGISSGDILTLARPVVVKERQQIVPSDRSSGANSSGKVAQNIVTRKSQKKPTSIADLEKKRKELLKITRQKVTNGSTVRMTSSAGRILQRMANVGGFAMLMGRVVKTAPAKVPAKKGTSIAEIAKSESAAKSVTEVLAVCEIFQYSDSEEGSDINKSQPQNLCDLPAVAVFVQLAKALGLGVVGCCIGVPSHSLGDNWCDSCCRMRSHDC